jgi:hypothetical protein
MSADPDVLEFKNERKPLVGLLLSAMGLAALILPSVVSGFEDFPLWVRLLTGMICLVPGLWMLFGLSVHRFDRRQGTVTSAWGLLVPFKSSERPTSDFRTVVICKERETESRKQRATSNTTVQNQTRTYFVYPVKLICEDDPPEMDFVDLIDDSDSVIDGLKKLREFGAKMHELESERKASGRASLTLGKPSSHTKALEMAEQVADFLGLRLCDLGVRT